MFVTSLYKQVGDIRYNIAEDDMFYRFSVFGPKIVGNVECYLKRIYSSPEEAFAEFEKIPLKKFTGPLFQTEAWSGW